MKLGDTCSTSVRMPSSSYTLQNTYIHNSSCVCARGTLSLTLLPFSLSFSLSPCLPLSSPQQPHSALAAVIGFSLSLPIQASLLSLFLQALTGLTHLPLSSIPWLLQMAVGSGTIGHEYQVICYYGKFFSKLNSAIWQNV